MNRVTVMILSFGVMSCGLNEKREEHAVLFDPAVIHEFAVAKASADKWRSIAMTDSLLALAVKDSAAYSQVSAYLENYFGDPNSPYRNEDLYIHLLQEKMRSPWCDSVQKQQYRSILYLCMQNRPGNAANDFVFVTPSGRKKKMYDINADYTLLMFYIPGCDACKQIKSDLIRSQVVHTKVASGDLKLLAVYADKDQKMWLDNLDEMPNSWIHGMDENEYLYKNSMYDLKAIPTVYLLDRNKNVVLKDCMDISLIEKKLCLKD